MGLRIWAQVIVLLIIIIGGILPTAVAAQDSLRLASVPLDTPAAMYRHLLPLSRYLSQEMGQPVTLKLEKDFADAIQEVATGKVDLAYLTPVTYIEAHARGQAQLVVKTVTQGQGTFKLMIIVSNDSPIRQAEQLKGKKFAFGDRAALLERATLRAAGINMESLGDYRFLGQHDNIVRAVLRGEFEAGIVKDTIAHEWEGKGIRIVYASRPLPSFNIAASKNMSKEMLEKLRGLFLKLNYRNAEHLHIIRSLDKSYDGFAPVTDKEYDVVRELIAPFHRH